MEASFYDHYMGLPSTEALEFQFKQDCLKYHEPRQKHWPTELVLNHQLYGPKKGLHTRVEFITGTDAIIVRRTQGVVHSLEGKMAGVILAS